VADAGAPGAQGVVHAEVYVSVGVIYYWRRCEFEPLFLGMERARARAEAELGISLYWIFDAVRHFGPEEAARVFRKAAELRPQFPSIVGIGIGGDERRVGQSRFANFMRRLATLGSGSLRTPERRLVRKASGGRSTSARNALAMLSRRCTIPN